MVTQVQSTPAWQKEDIFALEQDKDTILKDLAHASPKQRKAAEKLLKGINTAETEIKDNKLTESQAATVLSAIYDGIHSIFPSK